MLFCSTSWNNKFRQRKIWLNCCCTSHSLVWLWQVLRRSKTNSKNNALLCVVGYSRVKINEQIDNLITDFYTNIIGSYWDKERKYIDENYTTIPFPFDEIQTPNFVNSQNWTLEHLIGYLNTWSAVKHFIKRTITIQLIYCKRYWTALEQRTY